MKKYNKGYAYSWGGITRHDGEPSFLMGRYEESHHNCDGYLRRAHTKNGYTNLLSKFFGLIKKEVPCCPQVMLTKWFNAGSCGCNPGNHADDPKVPLICLRKGITEWGTDVYLLMDEKGEEYLVIAQWSNSASHYSFTI